jgi:hypothetical protein
VPLVTRTLGHDLPETIWGTPFADVDELPPHAAVARTTPIAAAKSVDLTRDAGACASAM